MNDYLLRDVADNILQEGQTLAVSTTRGIRVGELERINRYVGDHDTKYTLTIKKHYPGIKRQTIDYEQRNVFII